MTTRSGTSAVACGALVSKSHKTEPLSAGGYVFPTVSVALPLYMPPGLTSHGLAYTSYVPAGGLFSGTVSADPAPFVELPTRVPSGP